MMKNNKIILFSTICSLFLSIFWFFDEFLMIQCFAENQRLIFDEKMDNQKSIKKQKYDHLFFENHSNNNKYDENNDKMLQKRKIYKT